MPFSLRLILLALLATGLAAFAPSAGGEVSAGDDGSLHGPAVVRVRDLPPATQRNGPSDRKIERRYSKNVTAAAPLSETPAASGGAPSQAAVAVASPQSLVTSFIGVNNDTNASVVGVTVEPPDAQLAVGPQHIAEFVNLVGRIYTRSGSTLQTFGLDTFFQLPSGYFGSDPRIFYDALSSRWFASFLAYKDLPGTASDVGRLYVAVSQTDDPTGTWNVYFASYSQLLPDQPWLGLSNNKVTISSNMYQITGNDSVCPPFSDGFAGEQTIVIEKADLIAGAASARAASLARACDRYSVHPVESLSGTDDQYLATFDDSNLNRLTLFKITGTPAASNVAEVQVANLAIQSQANPPLAVVPGPTGNTSLDAGDRRILDAVWRDGTLWVSASALCVIGSDALSCAHLIQVSTGDNTVLQDMMYGGPSGEYWFYPSLTIDPDGNLYVTVTHSSSSIQPEARLLSRLTADAANTLRPSVLLKAGEVNYASTYHRWGDYLGTALDPTVPGCAWSVGEYTKTVSGPNWGTYIGSSTLTGGCQDADSDGVPDATDNCPSVANLSQTNSDAALAAGGASVSGDALGDACDPDDDNDGFSDVVETHIGTNPLDNCTNGPGSGGDAWPLDNNANGLVNVVDILAYKNKTPHAVDATHPKRLDLNDDGLLNVSDILKYKGVAPSSCN